MEPKKITIPYEFTVKPYMLPFLASKARFKVAVIHRRGRKTRMALNQQISRAVTKKGVYY
jgi:dihydropteroate synthase